MALTDGVRLAFLLAFVAGALGAASARFIVEKNKVRVLAPPDIRGENEAAMANFGIPSYGGSLTGVVLYPDASPTGCFPFNSTFRSKSDRPVILLVDRGDCYFALKIWNAQVAGAASVLVTDNTDEPLLTMDLADEAINTDHVDNITIPSALITRGFGSTLKKAATKNGPEVVVQLDWTESVPNPDERVEYDLWISSNDECGPRCDQQNEFVNNFKGYAQILEKGGYTEFSPHYITWICPDSFVRSKPCQSQCINRGRYCSSDPEQDFSIGYEGKDVVLENLRQLCVHQVAKESGRPWIWWYFVSDYHIRCSMKDGNYSKECAEEVVKSFDLPADGMKKCMGDPEADQDNDVLLLEQVFKNSMGTRGLISVLPTLFVNDVQYRGKLEATAVLKAICAGFKETTEPAVCLTPKMEINECLKNNGGCWSDKNMNITACRDTFRGRVCECPFVNGIQYKGDGYVDCAVVGQGRCGANNGGCWNDVKDGKSFSACLETNLTGCACPPGFRGTGYECTDIDECSEMHVCSCPGCSCENNWGGYECHCNGNSLYIKKGDICLSKSASNAPFIMTMMVLVIIVTAGIAGFIIYRNRLKSYMDAEIMAIMSQYMPLENRNVQLQDLDEL